MRKLLFMVCIASVASQTAGFGQNYTIIALSHENHMVYELDPNTGKILHELSVPDQPHEAAISPDGKTIFVSIPGSALVEVIDATSFKEKAKIETEYFKRPPRPRPQSEGDQGARPNTSASPHGISLNTDGSKLYVGVQNAEVPGVVVYDVKSGKVLKKIDLLLRGGHYLQFQPGTDKLYYPHIDDNRVVVLDTKTDKILKVISVSGGPEGVAFALNGEVWFNGDADGTVTIVDGKKDEVTKVIPTSGRGTGRVAVSPDGKFAVATHRDTEDVALIDAQNKQVLSTIHVGKGGGFPVFSPDSSKLYIMNLREGDICVIDPKTARITSRFRVGTGPFGGGLRFLDGKKSSQQ